MGKKLKTNNKIFKAKEQLPPPDNSEYLLTEFSLEQFEKSLAAMLETITQKRNQFQQEFMMNPQSPLKPLNHKTPEKHLEDFFANKDYWLHNTSHQKFAETNHKEKIIDESTASSGSVDSSCTFMLPQSLNKMKELAYKRSTNNSHYNLNRTPLHCLQRTRKSFIETPTSEIKSEFALFDERLKNGGDFLMNTVSDELFFTARKDIQTPIGKQVSSRISTFQDLIEKMPDLYMKGQKYFKLGELSIEDILHKIYFERYSYLDLRAYIPLASRKTQNLELFLDILYMSIKEFALRARNYLLTRLLGVVIKEKKIIKGDNGEAQVVHEFGGYKRFAKHAKRYIGLIKRMYEATKSLEAVALEAEKVCWTYLKPLLKDEKRFCCLEFHRQIFVKYYFSEPLIKDFLESISTYFEERPFYIRNDPTATRQLKELREFYQLWQCDGLPEEFDEDYQSTNIPTIREECDFEVKGKNTAALTREEQECIIRDLHKEYQNLEENKSSVKKKKRNKKKNKKGKEVAPVVDEAEKFIEEVSISVDTSEFDEEVQEFERKLEEQRIPKKIRKKVKPNISPEWIERLRTELQKKRNQKAFH